MKALQFYKPNKVLSINDVATPTIQSPYDVIVRVVNSGVCGTDLHAMKGEFPLPDYAITLGHEFCGVVTDVGAKVTKVKVGDRVSVNPNKGCHFCQYCGRGQPHYCLTEAARDNIGFYRQGSWAPLTVAPQESVHPIPDSLCFDSAVLCEPLSCIIHGWDRIQPLDGDSKILIVGAGIIGLLWSCLLHHKGFRDVIVSEPVQARRDRIKSLNLGFQAVAPTELRALMENVDPVINGVDLVVDCSGNARAMEETMPWLRRGGQLCLFGVAPPDARVSVSPFDILNQELSIVGVVINPFTFPQAVGMAANMQDRYLDLTKLGVQKFALDEYDSALQELKEGNISKAVFTFPQ